MVLTAADGVTYAFCMLLPDIADVCKVCDFSDLFEVTVLSRPLKGILELVGLVEMVFDGFLCLPVTIMMSSIHEAPASSTRYWMVGLL